MNTVGVNSPGRTNKSQQRRPLTAIQDQVSFHTIDRSTVHCNL